MYGYLTKNRHSESKPEIKRKDERLYSVSWVILWKSEV